MSDTDRWQQIEDLFHSALERATGERDSYLTAACASDADLRAQVDALLSAHGRAENPLDSPVFELAAGPPVAEKDEIGTGSVIGHYQILAPLGKGGMGAVIPGDAPGHAALRRAKGHRAGVDGPAGVRHALPPRGRGCRPFAPPERRGRDRLRLRQARRGQHRLPGDGIPGRLRLIRNSGRGSPAAADVGSGHSGTSLLSGRRGAPTGDHPPRPEAGEHLA